MTKQETAIVLVLATMVVVVFCVLFGLFVALSPGHPNQPQPSLVAIASPIALTDTPIPTNTPPLTPTAIPSMPATATWVILPSSPTVQSGQNGIYVDAKNLVLSLQDIPPGFHIDQTQTRVISNQVSANSRLNSSEYLKTLENWGRVSGYEIAFTKEPSLSNLIGIFSIISIVSQYKSSDGAHQSFSTLPNEMPSGFSQISVPVIGDETFGLVANQTANSVKATGYAVSFRYRNIIGSVITSGLSGTVGPNDTMDLAQKLLQRVMRASGS